MRRPPHVDHLSNSEVVEGACARRPARPRVAFMDDSRWSIYGAERFVGVANACHARALAGSL